MSVVGCLTLIISVAFQAYSWLIIVRVFIMLIRPRTYHPAISFVYEATEPLLGFFRRLLPPTGMFDFSPLIAVLFLEIARPIVIMLVIRLLNPGG
jgi:YggT family protein